MKRISALVLFSYYDGITYCICRKMLMTKIVDFDININGVYVDNLHSDYPLINFKGITYIPMTSDFVQALGLNLIWDDQLGISIDVGSNTQELKSKNLCLQITH